MGTTGTIMGVLALPQGAAAGDSRSSGASRRRARASPASAAGRRRTCRRSTSRSASTASSTSRRPTPRTRRASLAREEGSSAARARAAPCGRRARSARARGRRKGRHRRVHHLRPRRSLPLVAALRRPRGQPWPRRRRKTMQVSLERSGTRPSRRPPDSGGTLVVDGAPDIGGEGRGCDRWSCCSRRSRAAARWTLSTSSDKQKEPLEHLRIEIEGERADTVPLRLHAHEAGFRGDGRRRRAQVRARGVARGREVLLGARMLAKEVEVTWRAWVERPAKGP